MQWLLASRDKRRGQLKTTFTISNRGFYECNSVSLGFTNALLHSSALWGALLKGMPHILDDILIFKSFDENVLWLDAVFQMIA